MVRALSSNKQTASNTRVKLYEARSLQQLLSSWRGYVEQRAPTRPLTLDPAWLNVLQSGLGHAPYMIEAREGNEVRGLLPLAYVSSMLFGRHLVSLPYLNYGGVLADNSQIAGQLVEQAIALANDRDVGYLEFRHETPIKHPALEKMGSDKVNVRLHLPSSADELWSKLSAKVRNQIRKARKNALTVSWGGLELVDDFYRVFSWNMRDLGTPVYSKRLFTAILGEFPERSELCIIRAGKQAVAAGLLLHGWGISEVPSASSLRHFNHTCANMLLYWSMLERSVERGQMVFDFGRSTRNSSSFKFKSQWGAEPADASWQYYVRSGSPQHSRKESRRYQLLIRLWRRLPLCVTRLLGPSIVRGIP